MAAPIEILLLVREVDRERWVVARNAYGDQKVLIRTTRMHGPEKRDRVEAELRSMPFDEWCARYGVAAGWCRGEPEAVAAAEDPRSTRRSAPKLFLVATALFASVWWFRVVPLGGPEAAGGVLVWLVFVAVAYPLVVWRMKNTRFDG